ALGFRLLAKFRSIDLAFEAGRYSLNTNMSAGAALDALAAGPIKPKGVTLSFPEGLRLDQVAGEVRSDLGITRKTFLQAAESGTYSLPPYLPNGTKTAEGFLFPNTYELPSGSDADAVIQRLFEEFQTETKDLPWDNAKNLGVTPYQVVTVASIIEREAKFQEDRPKIAAVIYNRLQKGMPL